MMIIVRDALRCELKPGMGELGLHRMTKYAPVWRATRGVDVHRPPSSSAVFICASVTLFSPSQTWQFPVSQSLTRLSQLLVAHLSRKQLRRVLDALDRDVMLGEGDAVLGRYRTEGRVHRRDIGRLPGNFSRGPGDGDGRVRRAARTRRPQADRSWCPRAPRRRRRVR